MDSLFKRIGGDAALSAAVPLFYQKVLADKRIKNFFKGVDMDRQEKKQKEFLKFAFGGRKSFSGKALKNAHSNLVEQGLDDSHFDAVIECFGETLTELGIEASLIKEAADIAESVRGDVLGTNTTAEKGTTMANKDLDENSNTKNAQEMQGYIDAIIKAQAVIEFNMDGTIITANENFCETLGYSLDEIKGQHHKIFVEKDYANSSEYKEFWEKLNRGDFEANQYKRIGKGGKEVWIQASYNPIMDLNGDPVKVVKFASDISETIKAGLSQSAVDGSATAMMMVDRDFIITYANQSTMDMVEENLEYFEASFKGFDLPGLIGTCIDIFHKNPLHQRKLLSDPSNLPYKAEITVGPLSFSLNVSAMMDTAGHYIGNTLEWSDITESKAAAEESARIQSAVDGSATAMMMVDRDFIITYTNDATVSMIRDNLSYFESSFSGFNLDTLMGCCIDVFHKNPAHQRKLLADPSNLPYKAEISVGPLTFALNVSAMRDLSGEYIGNTLEWSDISEQKRAADELESTINRVEQGTAELSTASEALSELATGMVSQVEKITEETSVVASGAEQMSGTMINVSSASDEASSNIDSVAVATEEMTNTVNDIANNAEKARDVTQNAVKNVEQASERVGELGQAAKEISMVIEAIVEIAEQTKLLALNATIEAARAGEAGKGFAVVANEVKELAKQTRDATADIRTKIENIQASTDATVGEIGNINTVIGDVNEIVTIIATAVEEQNVTTKDIASNIGQASQGVKAVTSDITQTTQVSKDMANNLNSINGGIGEIKEATNNVDNQVRDVSRTAGMLQQLVDELKSKQA